MIHQTTHIIGIIAAVVTLSSLAYYALAIYCATAFLKSKRTQKPSGTHCPPVSILKPLKGTDPDMYENFRSHVLQDYPEYEIIFGVSEADDPAIAVVERLKNEFPERTIRLVICSKTLGSNIKVSNLAQMLPVVRYDILLVNDSDIRVEPDYLARTIAPLEDPSVGMVTCLYRGVAAATLGSRLESLGISTDFCPGVLVARQLESIRFGLGSTLAFRRNDLQKIGGFESLVDYLADDYELGRRIASLGLKIELSEAMVESHLPPYSFRQFLEHQLRWARTIRNARRGGYLGLIFTFGIPWALLTIVAASGAPWALALLGVVIILRFGIAFLVGRKVLNDRQLLRSFWLIPLRDILALFIWIASFAGHTVSWRGDCFTLKDGKLARRSASHV